tara:strand:- start:613 stop:816 length:204 start_codon:yes stop_codon:yes gene_type:complete
MANKNEIMTIEYTLKSIFNKNKIRSVDVVMANKLFDKWKKLTNYVEDTKYPVIEYILEEQPNYKSKI